MKNELTPRQKAFAEYYASDPCGERAALSAGYAPGSARQQGARLLTNANILAYIRDLQNSISESRILTAIETKMFWSDIIRDTSQRMSDRLSASNYLAKSGGLFKNHTEMDVQNDEATMIYLPSRRGEDGEWLDSPGTYEDIVIYIPEND